MGTVQVIAGAIVGAIMAAPSTAAPHELSQRFGVVFDSQRVQRSLADYDHRSLGGFGWCLDGLADSPGPLLGAVDQPIQYIPTVGRNATPPAPNAVRDLIQAHPELYPPGTVWMIGHELGRDGYTSVPGQAAQPFDHEAYATSFNAWATQIRNADPTFRIMLGAMIPGDDTGFVHDNTASLSNLFTTYYSKYQTEMPVDVFNLRLLFDRQHASLACLKSQIVEFRSWMRKVQYARFESTDYRGSELWLNGYGVFETPSFTPQSVAFLQGATDWLCGDGAADFRDAANGLPADDYRLVQRWAWFALDDTRPEFADTRLLMPDGTLSPLGEAYAAYLPHLPEPASLLLLTALTALAGIRRRA